MNVLFLCKGNSARSQMAEGFARSLSNNRFSFFSAGTWPSRHVHPVAVQVMSEVGIDIRDFQPKSFMDVPRPISYIVSLCGLEGDECPVVPEGKLERWDIPDPAHQGVPLSDEEELQLFRRVRDQIEHLTRGFLEIHEGA